ncbi:MAG: potassium-transporting ATPase subunit KdpC [Bacteroidota bacterium]
MVKNLALTGCISVVMYTLVTGVLYPLAVTGIAQLAFPDRANGSLVSEGGKIVGSELIGQRFTSARYIWSRPSATPEYSYNGGSSAGSNYGPLNPALLNAVKQRVHRLHSADPANQRPIPVDLVTASASGLDPHISVAAALYQVPRVSLERHLRAEEVRIIVEHSIVPRTFGILGEPRVNVLQLNLMLDRHGKGGN